MSTNRYHCICALVAGAIAFAGGPAGAQLTPAVRSDLSRQGFTAADFKSFEVTSIVPTSRSFYRWRDCVRSVALPTVQQKPLAEAEQIAFGLCSEQEEDAQAAIAAKTGLRQAGRVMRMARVVEATYLRQLFAEAHPSAPAGAEHIGGWTVFTGSDGRCGTFITTQDLFAAGGVILERMVGQAAPKLTFMLRGDVASEVLKTPVPRSDAVSLSVFSNYAGRKIGSLPVTLSENSGQLSIVGTPTTAQFEAMRDAESIQLNGSLGRPVSLRIDGLGTVWSRLYRCGTATQPTLSRIK